MKRPLKPVKEQLRDLFSMHVAERRGSLVMILALSLCGAWAVYEQWFHHPDPVDLGPLGAELEAWVAERENEARTDTVTQAFFPFDPNTLERSGWLALGLSERQVDGLERFKNKGGRFRTKGDLARMYSIRPEQYEELKPFIQLPDSLARRVYPDRPKYERDTARRRWPQQTYTATERPAPRKVEVNAADTIMLEALPGIGPSFARGIVKYRESLGGYRSLDQLAEVYVLKDKPDAVIRLKELLVVDTLMVRRIRINICTVEELAAHPYARWKIAKPLIAFRARHGPFKQITDIKGCAMVDAEVFRKLAPYLTVE